MNINAKLKQCLQTLSRSYNDGSFVPILEADVVGYLYHLWVSQHGMLNKVHLETRLCVSHNPNEKFDFVIGEVEYSGVRPCIKKLELVIEVKSYPIGFTDPQHRVHWSHVIEDDIPKLARIKEPLTNRYLLLFDEDDYLKGLYRAQKMSKLDYIKHVRDNKDKEIVIVNMRKTESLLWEFL